MRQYMPCPTIIQTIQTRKLSEQIRVEATGETSGEEEDVIFLFGLLAISAQTAEIFSFLTTLGFIKVFITFVAYPTQILWNFKRRSTSGLSLKFYMLDFCGANCSVLQNVTLAWLANDAGILMGNLPKVIMGSIGICYTSTMLFQFWWYGQKANAKNYDVLEVFLV
jgi:uncharacterized protein with PQ loop repeat